MATQSLSRYLLSKPKSLTSFLFPSCRPFSSFSPAAAASPVKTLITSSPSPSLFFLRRLRAPLCYSLLLRDSLFPTVKSFSTRAARSSLNDPSPNYSNRPPKETILLDGCDFEHWLVVVEPPKEDATRDEIIDSYIKTLAQVVGSEDEARMKIYSVSTRHYYAFGALVSEELSYKIKVCFEKCFLCPPNQGWSGNMGGNAQNFQNPYQGNTQNVQYPNNHPPNMGGPGGNYQS
ncbi:hypothetical protein GOBAR_DD18278 [Gossypium barbadense]|nr:hypothetical protein GOBAR_DD18278 [Gossypium barbadense]